MIGTVPGLHNSRCRARGEWRSSRGRLSGTRLHRESLVWLIHVDPVMLAKQDSGPASVLQSCKRLSCGCCPCSAPVRQLRIAPLAIDAPTLACAVELQPPESGSQAVGPLFLVLGTAWLVPSSTQTCPEFASQKVPWPWLSLPPSSLGPHVVQPWLRIRGKCISNRFPP